MMEGDARFTVSPMKSYQGWNSYEVSYNIKSNIKPINTPTNLVSPLKFYLETMLAYIKSPSEKLGLKHHHQKIFRTKFWKSQNTQKQIQKQFMSILKVKMENSHSFKEDTASGKLVGTQYMYPTFLGKDGLRITVKYIPETGEWNFTNTWALSKN